MTSLVSISEDTNLSDSVHVYLVNTSSGDINVTLPAPAYPGIWFSIKNTGDTNDVIVNPNDSENIDGSSSLTISPSSYASIASCENGHWWII